MLRKNGERGFGRIWKTLSGKVLTTSMTRITFFTTFVFEAMSTVWRDACVKTATVTVCLLNLLDGWGLNWTLMHIAAQSNIVDIGQG